MAGARTRCKRGALVAGLVGLVAWAGALAPPVRAQTSDTTRSVGVPVRVQTGGGVRIRSVHDARPRIYLARPPATGGAPSAEGVTQRDLDLFEERLVRQLETIILWPYRVEGGRDTLFVVEPPDERSLRMPPLPPGSLRERLAEPVEVAPTAGTATVERVERAILETGLFRATNVNFEFDRAALLPAATRTLDLVGDVLRRYPGLRVEIGGHTDAVGPAAYNLALSQARAGAVRAYLIERHGIEEERLVAQGYGESRPVAENANPTGRTLNRRVEFVVLNPEAAERYSRSVRAGTPAGVPAATGPDTLAAALDRAERRLLRRIDVLEQRLLAEPTPPAAAPPGLPVEPQPRWAVVGVRPVVGFDFDAPHQAFVGGRVEIRRGLRWMPEVLFGLGGDTPATTTANLNAALDVGVGPLRRFRPYLGAGPGLYNDGRLDVQLNLLVGVEPSVRIGTFFVEYVALDLFQRHRLLAGYRLDL